MGEKVAGLGSECLQGFAIVGEVEVAWRVDPRLQEDGLAIPIPMPFLTTPR